MESVEDKVIDLTGDTDEEAEAEDDDGSEEAIHE